MPDISRQRKELPVLLGIDRLRQFFRPSFQGASHEQKHDCRNRPDRRYGGGLRSLFFGHLDGSRLSTTQRIIRIHDRADGRFVTRNDRPADSPLGVDTSLALAMGTAHREAAMTARDEGCIVIVQRLRGARWVEVDRVEPPR